MLATSGSIQLLDEWVADALKLLLHGLELLLLGMLSRVQPGHDFSDLVLNGLLVIFLEAILGSDALSSNGILISELLSLTDHALDVVLGKTTLVVGDGNVGLLARGRLVLSGYVQHTVGINIKGDLNLWCSTRGWRDASKLEFAKQVVVLGTGALTLVHLDQHTWLVVSVGGEGLGLLGWDGGVARDQGGHDATSGLETHGKRGDVQQKDVLVASGTASQNVGLDSGAICNSLVRVDGATWLLAVEVVGDQLLDPM